MKQLPLIILLALALPFAVFAQKKDKEEKYVQKLTESTCDCARGKDFTTMSRQQMELELGVCILKAINENKDAVKALNIDISNSESMGSLGEKIGMKMAEVCPTEIMAIGLIALEEEETDTNADEQPYYPDYFELSGTLKAIEGGEFNRLVIVDADGEEHKLIWLGYFEGSDVLINAPEKAIGKSVLAEYKYIECFSPETKEYYEELEVTYLQLTE